MQSGVGICFNHVSFGVYWHGGGGGPVVFFFFFFGLACNVGEAVRPPVTYPRCNTEWLDYSSSSSVLKVTMLDPDPTASATRRIKP